MKKKLLFLMAFLAVSLLASAEMTVYVYKKDGTKVPYVASAVDSIGFVNVHTITFNANGGTGSMDVVCVKVGESITLPTNEFTNAKAEFVSWNTKTDGSGTAYTDQSTITPTANMTLYAQWKSTTSGFANGHEWVDLGLPSRLKWATCNVGADSPEKYGDHFAWGETNKKSLYGIDNYNFSIDPTTLPLDMDAAFINWGSSWRMPTEAELEELWNTSYTTRTWTTQNGVKGYKVTSKTNGNSIFLPAAGYRAFYQWEEEGSAGYYWSSSLYSTNSAGYANSLFFDNGASGDTRDSRYYGLSVRPVLVDVPTITFNANGGKGNMDVFYVKDGGSVTLPANTFTNGLFTFVGWNTAADGSGTAYADKGTVKPTANITLYAQWEAPKATGITDGHEWVDLGLPSGTKWATMNVGADSPEKYGDYFAWGETNEKSLYGDDYDYSINPTTLPLDMDAAFINWGTSWRMPTDAEVEELGDNCTWTWTTHNGVEGCIVTSKTNGNSIFLPAAGYRTYYQWEEEGSDGYYWSSSLYKVSGNSGYAYCLHFDNSNGGSDGTNYRSRGLSVRPVLRE